MKALLNALLSLWKQAPLWRLCVILGVGGLAMAAFFPTSALKKHAPWLPGKAPHTTPKNTSHAEGGGADAHDDGAVNRTPLHLQYPSMSEIVRNHIAMAGHTVPLPQGDWHPILSAQISSDSPLSFLALVRTEQGAITGLIIAQATQQPVAADKADSATNVCHDDRNYLNHSLVVTPAGEDCIGSGVVIMQGDDVSNNPLINQSIARLQALGVTPIPPLFLTVQWRHVVLSSPGQVQVGVVDTLIPPLDSQTRQFIAPLKAWPKETLSSYPAARDFIAKMRNWALQWQTTLQLGFDNQLEGHPIPRDPEAP